MLLSKPIRRTEIVAVARRWIGTPYHHQASSLDIGVDCIGLVRGVYRELHGHEPELLPAYRQDWAEATGEETLLLAARRHMHEIAPAEIAEGDVAVFRYRPRLVAKHTGIVGGAGRGGAKFTLIHAVEGQPVTEVPLSDWWRRRMAAAFRFRGVID